MKTPDEIKKGLEIAVNGCLPCDRPITDCPYDLECRPTSKDTNIDMPKQMAADAIAYIQQLENHIGKLTEKVAQLEAAQPRWISVSDELPKERGYYLVACEREDITRILYFHGKTWSVSQSHYKVPEYWMPLPEAPKEDASHEQ